MKKVEGSGLHCGRITGKQAVRRQDGRLGRPRLSGGGQLLIGNPQGRDWTRFYSNPEIFLSSNSYTSSSLSILEAVYHSS